MGVDGRSTSFFGWSTSPRTLKLKLAVADLGAFPVRRRGVNVRCTEQQSHLHGLVLYRLEWTADID